MNESKRDDTTTIVGVAEGFSGLDPAGSPQIRVPIQMISVVNFKLEPPLRAE